MSWMTLDTCVRHFQKKSPEITREEVSHCLWRHKVRKRYKTIGHHKGKGRNSLKQMYYGYDVIKAVKKYKPRGKHSEHGRATYVRTTPPPEGWYTLREISERLGCTLTRISSLCNKFTVCSHMWEGKRYAELERFRYLILWRPRYFVEKHRTQKWADKRLMWQLLNGISTPEEFKYAFWTAIYAPELAHL